MSQLFLSARLNDSSVLPVYLPADMSLRYFAPLAFWAATIQAATPTPAATTPAKVSGFTHVKTAGNISEYRLDSNGLQVLLMEDHSSPTLTFMVTYRVGSRNEVTGTTGATHLLEHLMFKGTPKFNREKGTSVNQLL